MGYGDDEANEAIRLSWCHLTPEVDCPPLGPAGMRPPDRFSWGANAPSGLGGDGAEDSESEVKPRLSKID